jgi:hypothetical protein
MGNRALSADESLHEVRAVVHRLIAELIRAERAGYSREEIAEALAEARAVHRTSPFIKHCQDWPRGYPGDFEMIGWLLNPHVRASVDAVGYALEHMALHCLAAQSASQQGAISDRAGHAHVARAIRSAEDIECGLWRRA